MNTTNNTILITGGSAGIGLQMAKQFTERGNHVVIVGRNKERLEQAAAGLTNVTAIACDVSNEKEVNAMVERLYKDFPQLNVLINNAGRAHAYSLTDDYNAFEKASDEIMTNYLSVINLTEKLLPLLKRQIEPAIVNVSSIVAFAPGAAIPTYSASKAALHAYTKILRYTLAQTTNIKVFDLMPPLVNTELSAGIGGANGIAPSVVAADLIDAMNRNHYQVHVGATEQIYQLSLSSPVDALVALNNN